MILAAGLTPAWQQIVALRRLEVGEVNRATEVRWAASGKVLNVGAALHFLGADQQTLFVAGGANGRAAREELKHLGVSFTAVECAAPTRVCTTILDEENDRTTELVENSQPMEPAALERFRREYAEKAGQARVIVLSGSLPEGTESDFYAGLMRGSAARHVLDVRGPELLEALPLKPSVVKPNREELEKTLGRDVSNEGELRAAMGEIVERGAEWIVVSQGGGPLLAMSKDESLRFHPPRDVDCVNPIGCGDCLAAGIALGLEEGMDAPEAIRLGMGAAAENAAMLLPARLDREWTERLAKAVFMEKW